MANRHWAKTNLAIAEQRIAQLEAEAAMWKRRYERAFGVVDAAIALLSVTPTPLPNLARAVSNWISETQDELVQQQEREAGDE